MLRNFVFCAFLFAVVLHHCRCASKSKNSSRTFFKYGYAVYKPGWSLDYDGYLQMYFKTEKQDAMLLYQDDSHEAGQFMDIFLVNGKLRLRMAIGSCSYAERTVNGSFSDLKWHKLVIRRELEETVVSVDNITTEPIKCSAQLSKMVAMYAGYLTLSQRREGSWVFPTAFWQSMQHGFVGCTRGMKYGYLGKESRPKINRTNGTRVGCGNACAVLKCRNGGKCVNRIIVAECDCRGTGYEGKHCARVIPTTPRATTAVTSPIPSTKSPVRIEVRKQKAKAPADTNKNYSWRTKPAVWVSMATVVLAVIAL